MKIKSSVLVFALAGILSACSEQAPQTSQQKPTAAASQKEEPSQEQIIETAAQTIPEPVEEEPVVAEEPLTSQQQDLPPPEVIEEEIKNLVDTIVSEADLGIPRDELERGIREMVDQIEPR